jgi:hypothetical protein
MLGKPVGNDEALETELGLKKSVQGLAVLAGIGVVHSVVGTPGEVLVASSMLFTSWCNIHDVSCSRLEGILERPQIQLMHSLIIEVAGDGLDGLVVGVGGRITVKLLLVGNEVL